MISYPNFLKLINLELFDGLEFVDEKGEFLGELLIGVVDKFGDIILNKNVIFTICVLTELMGFLDEEINFFEYARRAYLLDILFACIKGMLYRLEEHYTTIINCINNQT